MLPGIYWASHSDGRIQRAFFPFFGLVEKFLSWDRATFALFPLWLRIERYGRTTDYVLWPFFSVSRGTGGFGWRVWPLVGHNSWEGRYSRWFAAWPFLHFQRNDLQYPEDQQQLTGEVSSDVLEAMSQLVATILIDLNIERDMDMEASSSKLRELRRAVAGSSPARWL